MELQKSTQVFNLWDTNGRRADVLNAIDIYLNILDDIDKEYTGAAWETYPAGLTQFEFYKRAIEASPEVFKKHPNYDKFVNEVSEDMLKKRKTLTSDQMENLDTNIEQRARHYTSNLVRLGFATNKRKITPAGKAFMSGMVDRDTLEDILPIDDTNLALLRQLLKFRVYTKPDEEGDRKSYSPFFAALYLLMSERFDKEKFRVIIQSLTPYNPIDIDDVIDSYKRNDYSFLSNDFDVPDTFLGDKVIGQSEFEQHIRNVKSSSVEIIYYEFYKKLYDFRHKNCDKYFLALREVCVDNANKLKQAFGLGAKVFDFGRNLSYGLKEFNEHNKNNPLLAEGEYNPIFYTQYKLSKIADQVRENSDTTTRLFSATGLISYNKPLPELANSDVYEILFDKNRIKKLIFTSVTDKEYEESELSNDNLYNKNISLVEILKYGDSDIAAILDKIAVKTGNKIAGIKESLKTRISDQFKQHVSDNYPKERVIRLLRAFSDEGESSKARDEINPATGIPTAYEFIVALAWNYISDEKYDLYSSMNLTLSADFEPERFAGGGEGDVVVRCKDIIIMLEATMMNRLAQKRGEWEPVLRHSVNLRVNEAPKETMTFFVANELDYNTINIWRAVASVPLMATNTSDKVTGVKIMPLTNEEMANIIEQDISGNKLINLVQKSFESLDNAFDDEWRDKIFAEL